MADTRCRAKSHACRHGARQRHRRERLREERSLGVCAKLGALRRGRRGRRKREPAHCHRAARIAGAIRLACRIAGRTMLRRRHRHSAAAGHHPSHCAGRLSLRCGHRRHRADRPRRCRANASHSDLRHGKRGSGTLEQNQRGAGETDELSQYRLHSRSFYHNGRVSSSREASTNARRHLALVPTAARFSGPT